MFASVKRKNKIPIVPLAAPGLRGRTRQLRQRYSVARSLRGGVAGLACVVAGLCWIPSVAAQDLSPRFYWPAPRGTRLAVFGYSYSTGEVLMDRSLPVEGVDSSINMGFFAYMQTFGLWGRTSNLVVELPYSWGTTKGLLFENPVRRDFSGFGDLGISLAVNLIGAPSMTVAEFQELRADPF
ncbi:MAG: hypothetical protein ACYS0H_27865, partial [Planctomycetota bacterium]